MFADVLAVDRGRYTLTNLINLNINVNFSPDLDHDSNLSRSPESSQGQTLTLRPLDSAKYLLPLPATRVLTAAIADSVEAAASATVTAVVVTFPPPRRITKPYATNG